jgi:hypothetical protein
MSYCKADAQNSPVELVGEISGHIGRWTGPEKRSLPLSTRDQRKKY